VILSDLVESVVNAVSDAVGAVGSAVGRTAQAVANAVQYIIDDIESHQDVIFYVIGPNGLRLPVKIFESRSKYSGIPYLAGYAMNIGGEIHMGVEMAVDLIRTQLARDTQGIDLELNGTPIVHTSWPLPGTPEEIVAHEIGHQVDADKFGPGFYQAIGFVLTQDRGGKFEENASLRGEYYGIDWNYTP